MTLVAAPLPTIKPSAVEFPWDWFARCGALGRWPRQIAAALVEVNGPRWSWRFAGNVIDLWKHLVGRCPGFCGRDTFIAAWRLLVHEGLVAFGQAGWRAVTAAKRVAKRTKSGPETYVPVPGFQEPVPVPVSGPPTEERARAHVVGVGSSLDQNQTNNPVTLPPAPLARIMPMPANDRPAPKPLHPSIAKRCGKALAAGWRPGQAGGDPQRPETPTADVGALEGASRGQVSRPGYLTPAELARLAGAPEPAQPPAPEPPTQSPTQAQHVSTEPAFWSSRYPKLCELSERLWGSRARYKLEMQAGVHAELLGWSLRATDTVWADAVGALSMAKAEPGAIAKYLCGVLRRTVPVAEKARRGDVTVPVAPTVAPPPAASSTRPAPRRRSLADLLLAREEKACNLSGAHDPESQPQRTRDDLDLGGDRNDDRLLAEGGRRAS